MAKGKKSPDTVKKSSQSAKKSSKSVKFDIVIKKSAKKSPRSAKKSPKSSKKSPQSTKKSVKKSPDSSKTASTSGKKSRTQVTPAMGRTRGPHPQSPSGQAIVKLVSDLPREGYLARNPTGYIFLDLDDDWIFSLQQEMEKFGYEVPPYFVGPQAVGAHISVVPASFSNRYKDVEVDVGRKVVFEVIRAGPTFPTRYWYGAEAVYKIWVRSPQLNYISKRLAGPGYKPPGGFNIVVGVRKIKKRDQMIKKQMTKG